MTIQFTSSQLFAQVSFLDFRHLFQQYIAKHCGFFHTVPYSSFMASSNQLTVKFYWWAWGTNHYINSAQSYDNPIHIISAFYQDFPTVPKAALIVILIARYK